MQKDTCVKLVSYKPNRGKGHAVKTGIVTAIGNYTLFADVDLAYSPDQILGFLNKIMRTSIDGIVGS